MFAGANEKVLPTDFRSVVIFFLTLMADFPYCLKKNVDRKWNRFLKIFIFVEVGTEKYRKIGILGNYGDFEYFLVLLGP